MRIIRSLLLILPFMALTACAEVQYASHLAKAVFPVSKSQGTFKVGSPYKINGRTYHPRESYDLVETGIASWYGPQFHGKLTANGERFDMYELTAAHRTLQLPSLVRVTNLENGRSLVVRVNDRGPYKRERVIDLSKKAADLLGYKSKGTAKVRIEVLPQESRQIAMAAKNGYDTSGYEVAMNRHGNVRNMAPSRLASPPQPGSYQLASAKPMALSPDAVRREAIAPPQVITSRSAIPGHSRKGQFYPDPIITKTPVTATNIFIQTGSFTVYNNALRLRDRLENYAKTGVYPANVNGQHFYRVRVGPVASVEEADKLLARLIEGNFNTAMIIVE